MQIDVFVALVVFAFVMAFTPGPNNILLTASGVNFGFARTVPHLLGVDVGFVVMLAVFAAGLGLIFAALPGLQLLLKIAGAAYMLWLAWKVASARPVAEGGTGNMLGKPMTFLQAAAFQWVNPKAVVARSQRRRRLYAAGPRARGFCHRARGVSHSQRCCRPRPGPASAWRCAASCATPCMRGFSTPSWACCWSPASIRSSPIEGNAGTCGLAPGVLEAGPTLSGCKRGYHACLLRPGRRSQSDQGQESRHHRLWQPGPRPCAQSAR